MTRKLKGYAAIMEFLVIVLILSVFVGLFFLLINDNPSANRKQDVDVEDDLIMLMDLNDDDYMDDDD